MDMEEAYCSKSSSGATASAIVSPKSSSTSPKLTCPKKGILKHLNRSSSTTQEPNLNRYSIATSNATDIQHMDVSPTHQRKRSDSMNKKMHWDEMNILATYHPSDKDYGFMKVNEPPTPYNKCESISDDERDVPVDANKLESELNLNIKKLPKYMQEKNSISDNDDDDGDDQDLLKRNPAFEAHRKAHYDEFKMAQLLKSRINDDEEEDDDNSTNNLAKKVDTTLKTNQK